MKEILKLLLLNAINVMETKGRLQFDYFNGDNHKSSIAIDVDKELYFDRYDRRGEWVESSEEECIYAIEDTLKEINRKAENEQIDRDIELLREKKKHHFESSFT